MQLIFIYDITLQRKKRNAKCFKIGHIFGIRKTKCLLPFFDTNFFPLVVLGNENLDQGYWEKVK